MVFSFDLETKIKVIKDIYQSYLEKDIFDLIKIEKRESFSQLLSIIASQIGQLVNFNEISNTLGVDGETIKKYLWYLEKTFIIEKVTPFYRNVRKELSKTPIYYFTDLGLRNFILDGWLNLKNKVSDGFLFQNFVFQLLTSSSNFSTFKINFWRTKDKAEVDFILNAGEVIIPLEVKNQFLRKPVISKSLRSFLLKYQPKEAYLVNLNLKDEIKIGATKLKFVPYWYFVAEEKPLG